MFPDQMNDNFIMFVSQEVLDNRNELKVTFDVAIDPSSTLSGKQFENHVIAELSSITAEVKIENFLIDRSIPVIDIYLINRMSETPSLSPSTTPQPSIPTATDAPSLFPSISQVPSVAPSHLILYFFDIMLYFNNEADPLLDESEINHFTNALRNQLGMFTEFLQDTFIRVVSQEIVTPNVELKVTFAIGLDPLNGRTKNEVENIIIKRLGDPITESKVISYLTTRSIMVTDIAMLSRMSDTPSLAPSTSAAPSISTISVDTALFGTNGTALMTGNMITIQTFTNPIKVIGLGVFPSTERANILINIWTKVGGYELSIYNENDWTLIHQQNIPGSGKVEMLDDFACPIDISPNSEQSFYIQASHKVMLTRTEDGATDLTVTPDIEIYHDTGIAGYFDRKRDDQHWMGTVKYTLGTGPAGCNWQDIVIQ